jgi:hypothetical protein
MQEGPKVAPEYETLWMAFGHLTTMRPPSFSGISSIPFDKIILYAKYYGWTKAETDQLIQVIRALDEHYLEEMNKRSSSGRT